MGPHVSHSRLPFRVNFPRVFIVSPAHCGGERAQLLLRRQASFSLARQLRSREGCTLAEVFSFLSGLYFRGKIAYATAFTSPPPGAPKRSAASPLVEMCTTIKTTGALVITTNRGLIDPHTRITFDDLRAMGGGDIDPADPCYRQPLERDAAMLRDVLGPTGRAILLGSIASGKYCDILLKFLGTRLLFPQEFIGRGDMSRGGLMLRCVDQMKELTYIPIEGAVRRGSRPPKLEKRVRTKGIGSADERG
jgi:hypothetical protein